MTGWSLLQLVVPTMHIGDVTLCYCVQSSAAPAITLLLFALLHSFIHSLRSAASNAAATLPGLHKQQIIQQSMTNLT